MAVANYMLHIKSTDCWFSYSGYQVCMKIQYSVWWVWYRMLSNTLLWPILSIFVYIFTNSVWWFIQKITYPVACCMHHFFSFADKQVPRVWWNKNDKYHLYLCLKNSCGFNSNATSQIRAKKLIHVDSTYVAYAAFICTPLFDGWQRRTYIN